MRWSWGVFSREWLGTKEIFCSCCDIFSNPKSSGNFGATISFLWKTSNLITYTLFEHSCERHQTLLPIHCLSWLEIWDFKSWTTMSRLEGNSLNKKYLYFDWKSSKVKLIILTQGDILTSNLNRGMIHVGLQHLAIWNIYLLAIVSFQILWTFTYWNFSTPELLLQFLLLGPTFVIISLPFSHRQWVLRTKIKLTSWRSSLMQQYIWGFATKFDWLVDRGWVVGSKLSTFSPSMKALCPMQCQRHPLSSSHFHPTGC